MSQKTRYRLKTRTFEMVESKRASVEKRSKNIVTVEHSLTSLINDDTLVRIKQWPSHWAAVVYHNVKARQIRN